MDTYDYRVTPDTIVKTVIAHLEMCPGLPGVVIAEPGEFIGVVSRSKCLELLSGPYGNALFLKRSILNLYDELELPPTVMACETRIDKAVNIALARPLDQRYEPLIVDFGERHLRLLDLHVLLLAQSQMLENANRLTRRQVEIERALSSTLELDVVLQLILGYIGEMVPYDRAGIMLENHGVLEFVATREFPDTEDVQRFQVSGIHSAIYQQICEERRPLAYHDVSLQDGWKTVPGLPPTRSWIGIPLIHAQGVLGMLSLSRTVVKEFVEEEIRLAESFAGQAAVALQNARLYQEIKTFNQILEKRVQERTQALQLAYDKLELLDRAKSDFISVTSHELRTPLTVINCYAQMAQSYLQSNHMESVANGLKNGVKRMQTVINTMLDLVKIDQETIPLHYTSAHLNLVLYAIQEGFTKILEERHLMIKMEQLDGLPPIKADIEALQKIFTHLLTNAIKYTPDGGNITIIGRHWPSEESVLQTESVEIIIADTGIGIDPMHHDIIFTKFYRMGNVALHSSSQSNFKGGGPGLGLAITRGLVNAHHGKVWAESPGYDEETLPGSRFHVILPVHPPNRNS
ncbi:MAG: GAF domain-containing protein [Anaerolineae bacterium]|nr:GAF domain-containing protein [Anaerolineae bacterium]